MPLLIYSLKCIHGQVSTKLYGILSLLAERCPSFGRSSAALSIPHLSEKLGDAKLKKPAGDAMVAFAERTSLQFVLGHGMCLVFEFDSYLCLHLSIRAAVQAKGSQSFGRFPWVD
jgi:hypothetical protein